MLIQPIQDFMRTVITIIFLCIGLNLNLFAQTVTEKLALKNKIDSMFYDDQFWRKEYIKVSKKEHSDYDRETIEDKWSATDSLNEMKAKDIIKKYGYPGYNLIGEISDRFWAIIQHCDDDLPFQERVLTLMKKEVDKSNANKSNYAYLVDRVLVSRHQKQVYGTQLHIDTITHISSPFPLKYSNEVNKLRKQMGLEPLEKYLKTFNK